MSTNKSLVTEEDAKGPKDEIEKIREITWLPLTDLICPSRCITINCLFNLIFKRMADGERVPARESMKYELLRFATFRSCHSVGKPYFILFARAGFYYAEGQVRCYVCGVCMDIDSWTEKEDPSKIHKIYSPRCGFFSDDSGVNIPVPPLSPECMEKFKKLDELTESVDRHVGIQDVPRDEHKPSASRHPEFSEESTRLASFRKWPTTKTQTPRMMAACGFWYSGKLFYRLFKIIYRIYIMNLGGLMHTYIYSLVTGCLIIMLRMLLSKIDESGKVHFILYKNAFSSPLWEYITNIE